MKKGLTYIAVVLDESSSMSVARKATIEGMNTFFADQAKRPGEAKLTLVKFSSTVREPVYIDRPIGQVEPLNESTYWPNGMTALYDAIGQTIDLTGQRLAQMPEAERPEQVLVVIQTDGEENQSYKYSLEKIQTMIKHQKDVYNWDFIFMGQGIDSFAVSNTLGINAKSTFDFGVKSARNAYAVMSGYLGHARSVGHQNVTLSVNDRTKAMTPDVDLSNGPQQTI